MNGLHFTSRNTTWYTLFLLMVLFAMASVPDALSQGKFREGYIINLEGDTISGLISYKKNKLTSGKIYFKDQALYKAIEYTPTELKGFFIKDEQFVSAVVEQNISSPYANYLIDNQSMQSKVDTVFLQVLVFGDKSLFCMEDNNGQTHYLIRKGSHFQTLYPGKYGSTYNSHKEENAKHLLKEYLQDCPSMAAVIDQTKLQYKSLLKLFNTYYSCVPTKATYMQVL